MSKSQIRKQASEVRERIRYGVEAIRFAHPDDDILWFSGAAMLVKELEDEALTTVHDVEKELTTLRKASLAFLKVIENEEWSRGPFTNECTVLREALGKGPRS